jgi:hypothetical protein
MIWKQKEGTGTSSCP